VGACPNRRGLTTHASALPISITDRMDAGNIEVDRIDGSDVQLRIKKDPFTAGTDNMAHSQWFHFKASGVQGRECRFSITNCKETSYPDAWEGYNTCASFDAERWFRVPTEYDPTTGTLSWALTPDSADVWFAYFAPYTYEQHKALVARIGAHPAAELTVLGRTLEGRPLEMLTLGDGPAQVWVTARQHPGESMAEWLAEGLLDRLLDDTEARAAATWRVVPNMNPDGAIAGHLRTNASGANLNREWAATGDYAAPTAERSPEVLAVLGEMDAVGVDLHLDIHGDEETPANFFAGFEGIPGVTAQQLAHYGAFQDAMVAASPDFQTKMGYTEDEPGAANLAICTNQIAHRFGCVSVTFEQPFKDCWNAPDPERGWCPERATALGSATVTAVKGFIPTLLESRASAA